MGEVLHGGAGLEGCMTGLFECGVPMAGTSAGCDVMSKTM